MRAIVLAVVVAATITLPTGAFANWQSGFPCGVQFHPASKTSTLGFGNGGLVQVGLYSGVSCTGTYYGTTNFCTTGATSPACGTQYAAQELYQLYLAFMKSINGANRPIRVYYVASFAAGDIVIFGQ